MDNKNIFARNLQHQMDVNNKTRKDVCKALGFSYYTFSDWVNGKKYPRMDKVEMLADYFGILKSDLIEEKTEEKPAEKKAEETKKLVNKLSKNKNFMQSFYNITDKTYFPFLGISQL